MKTHFSSISTYRDLSICDFIFLATLMYTPPLPPTVNGQIIVGETEGPREAPTETKMKPQENHSILDSNALEKGSGAEAWGSSFNNMHGDYWYLDSEEEDRSSPELDSDLDDYADETDLNFSLDSEDDPDPDGPEAEIRAIFNMHNPTMLFTGRVTGRTDQLAATGPPPSTQTQQPHHDQQPRPPPQPAQPRRGGGA